MTFSTMFLKPISLKLAGGMLAVAMGVTAMTGAASADSPTQQFQCKPPQCPVIDIRADLRPANLTATKYGDKLWVSFQIKNQGAADAKSFKTRVFVNGVQAGEVSWVLVAGGDTVGETLANIPIPANAKLANVQVIVDATDVVNEKNEMNNTMTQSFFF